MAVGSGTTNSGFHYLLSGEGPDIAGITQQLANDIDVYLAARLAPVAKVLTRSGGSSTFANNTATTVAGWDGTPYDKGGIGYNAGVLTVPVGGLYSWTMTLTTPATSPAYAINLSVMVNGIVNASGQTQYNVPANSNSQSISAGGPLVLSPNDAVTLRAQQNSGAAMAITQVSASLVRIGPA